MATVYLDTNFLMIPGRNTVDIFTQIEELIPETVEFKVVDKTLDELKKRVEKGNTKDKLAAKLALLLIKQKHLKVVRTFLKKDVDDVLVSKVNQGEYVATQDKELKKRLKAQSVRILTLKNQAQVIEG